MNKQLKSQSKTKRRYREVSIVSSSENKKKLWETKFKSLGEFQTQVKNLKY